MIIIVVYFIIVVIIIIDNIIYYVCFERGRNDGKRGALPDPL